jgi:valyl-tRNA synthetase
VHHVLARAFKDMFPRYKIMRGYQCSRRGGWDTHGLPVEIEVEKQLGFTNKQQIEEYGIDKFNELCKKSVFTYIQDWERLTDRIAFWVDLEDAYVTYTNDYGIRTCCSRAIKWCPIARAAARRFRTMKSITQTQSRIPTIRQSLCGCRWPTSPRFRC